MYKLYKTTRSLKKENFKLQWCNFYYKTLKLLASHLISHRTKTRHGFKTEKEKCDSLFKKLQLVHMIHENGMYKSFENTA